MAHAVSVADPDATTSTFNDHMTKYKKHRGMPAFQAQVGLTWSLANKDKSTVDLAALYEVQYFIGTWRNQNSQTQNLFISDVGDQNLVFNGFTGMLKVGF